MYYIFIIGRSDMNSDTTTVDKRIEEARSTLKEYGYESECYIDPATGLLLGERSYDGAVLTYSMDSTVPELTAPEESLFAAP